MIVMCLSKLMLYSLVNLYSFDSPSPEQSLSGHTSFVYSITALPGVTGAVSSGEDGTLRVWSGEASLMLRTLNADAKTATGLVQTIAHPATSLWSSAAVPTASGKGIYIASSANDGVIRFFTQKKELMAPEGERERWSQAVAQRQLDK